MRIILKFKFIANIAKIPQKQTACKSSLQAVLTI